MAKIQHSQAIQGVYLVHLEAKADDRGRFLETYRAEWILGSPPMVQANRSDSLRGVLRGLHFHRKQADYWYVPSGRALVALYDVRRSSSTSGSRLGIEIGDGDEVAIYIPPGVAHGFLALTDVTMTYLVDSYFDGSDEFGVRYNDPDIAFPWPIKGEPILSERDGAAGLLRDLPDEARP
ncbi:MAG: dTDP-4-dehydrorhamnose 3,5-epimerase [Actinomycetota bacterium]